MRSRNTARVGQLVPRLEAETSHKNHLCAFGGGGSNTAFLACVADGLGVTDQIDAVDHSQIVTV